MLPLESPSRFRTQPTRLTNATPRHTAHRSQCRHMHMMPTCTCTHTHAHLQWFSTNQRASADYPTPSPLPGFACGAPVGRVRGDDELAFSSRGSRHHTWLARRQRLQPTWWAAIGDGSLPQQAHTQAQAQAQASWTRGSIADQRWHEVAHGSWCPGPTPPLPRAVVVALWPFPRRRGVWSEANPWSAGCESQSCA